MPVSLGRLPRSRRNASSPPADAPTPTIGNELRELRLALGGRSGALGFAAAGFPFFFFTTARFLLDVVRGHLRSAPPAPRRPRSALLGRSAWRAASGNPTRG